MAWLSNTDIMPTAKANQQAFNDYYQSLRDLVGPDAAASALGSLARWLHEAHQYRAAQTVDATRLTALSGGPMGLKDETAITEMVRRWADVDDQFACSVFEAALKPLSAAKTREAALSLSRLAMPWTNLPRELYPHISGSIRPMIAGHPSLGVLAEAAPTPGLLTRAVDAVHAFPREVALDACGDLLLAWGQSERAALPDETDDTNGILKRIDELEQATFQHPELAGRLLADRVWYLARASRVDEAVVAAQRFWDSKPKPSHWCGLIATTVGDALVKAGRTNEARAAYLNGYEQCLTVAPDYARLCVRALRELARLSQNPTEEGRWALEFERLTPVPGVSAQDEKHLH